MTRVLLTGGSGFIAAHVLDLLLEHGHSVVTTVRSEDKANKIKEAHPSIPQSRLDFAIVEDIAQEGAFDRAVVSDPPFEAVIHTASPFHFNAKDTKKDLLDPAINGTKGLLVAVKRSAPNVRRVVITSSFASILNGTLGTNCPDKTYSERDWNPITEEEAAQSPVNGYRASKTFAEKAAWEFETAEKPNFTVATICPPMVFGPVVHYLHSLEGLNTSNQRVRNMITGQCKGDIPETGTFIWVDVRDVALAHVKAMELASAADKRFFVTAGYYSNKEIVDIIRKNFPTYENELPARNAKGGDYPSVGIYKYDNSRAIDVLGIRFRTLEESIVDLVKSLQSMGA